MSEFKEIKIKILPNGEVKVNVFGEKGDKCLDLTKFLEDGLGSEILDRKFTQEYYEHESVKNSETSKY